MKSISGGRNPQVKPRCRTAYGGVQKTEEGGDSDVQPDPFQHYGEAREKTGSFPKGGPEQGWWRGEVFV